MKRSKTCLASATCDIRIATTDPVLCCLVLAATISVFAAVVYSLFHACSTPYWAAHPGPHCFSQHNLVKPFIFLSKCWSTHHRDGWPEIGNAVMNAPLQTSGFPKVPESQQSSMRPTAQWRVTKPCSTGKCFCCEISSSALVTANRYKQAGANDRHQHVSKRAQRAYL